MSQQALNELEGHDYKPPPLENTHPMEGLASIEELEKYRHQKGAFYLGNIHPDHGEEFEAGILDDIHVFIVAGNAAGKGRSLIVQNALRWKGGFICLDPKGELASITAMRRGLQEKALGTGTSVTQFMGQQVAILDPFNETVGAAKTHCVRFNPLSEIDPIAEDYQRKIKNIASACIVPEEGSNAHFSDLAEIIIAGIIEALLFTYPKEEQTLVKMREFILQDWEIIAALLQDQDIDAEIEEGQEPPKRGRLPSDGLAASAANVILKLLGSNEIGAFNSTITRNIEWLSEPEIKRQVSASDISLTELVQGGGSVYIVVPPDRIDDFKCWIRIITQTAIAAKIRLGVNQETQPTLFMLDEFALLGKFKIIEKSAGYLRGYNCKLACVIQNIGQVKTLYDKNWETFLGNAGAIIGFSTNDLETEQYLSDRMGKILAWETSYSVNSGRSHQANGGSSSDGKTTSQAQRERAVRMPNEIHEQGARETMRAFVVPASGKPFTILRQNYDDININGLYDSPSHNLEIERNSDEK